MLPVSAREFHDLGVQETNFGELPIIMGWVREKTPAKDGKSFARAFTGSVVGESGRTLSICEIF